jgi:hypothetical protein
VFSILLALTGSDYARQLQRSDVGLLGRHSLELSEFVGLRAKLIVETAENCKINAVEGHRKRNRAS